MRSVAKNQESLQNGDLIKPQQIIQNCEIREVLSTSINGVALVQILNKSDKNITLNLTKSIQTFSSNENN